MVSTHTLHPSEHARRIPPLGLRFWDLVHGRFVNDGLLVTATAVGLPGLPRIALPSSTGGFGFRTLPGLRDPDSVTGDSPFWPSAPIHRPFLIRMLDPQERYLPLTFRATAPHPGWFTPPDGCEFRLGSLPPGAFPLFPNPDRDFGDAFLCVRAQLWDSDENTPAAWAWVRWRLQMGTWSKLIQSLANHEGKVLIVVPKDGPPEVSRLPPSAASSLQGPPGDSFVSIGMSVNYGRLGGGPVPPPFCDILAQPFAATESHNLLESVFTAPGLTSGWQIRLRSPQEPEGRIRVRPGDRAR